MTRRTACAGLALAALTVAKSGRTRAAAFGSAPFPDAGPIAALEARRTQIAHVRVIHLARLISTYAAIGPRQLETYSGVTVTRESGPAIDAILAHVRSARVGRPFDATIDARWAFIFERTDRSRVGAIYLDEFGRTLATPDRSFRLERSADLYAWLHARYGRDGVLQ